MRTKFTLTVFWLDEIKLHCFKNSENSGVKTLTEAFLMLKNL